MPALLHTHVARMDRAAATDGTRIFLPPRVERYPTRGDNMALLEAKRKRITPFCLTVDPAGHDDMRAMGGDIGYDVLATIESLPRRLPTLYRTLTS